MNVPMIQAEEMQNGYQFRWKPERRRISLNVRMCEDNL